MRTEWQTGREGRAEISKDTPKPEPPIRFPFFDDYLHNIISSVSKHGNQIFPSSIFNFIYLEKETKNQMSESRCFNFFSLEVPMNRLFK